MIPPKTPRFQLPYIDPSQQQPEVKINEAWNIIDAALPGGSDVTSDGGGGDGSAGKDGARGRQGKSGERGRNGFPGQIGKQGPAGNSGVFVIRRHGEEKRRRSRPPGTPLPNTSVTPGSYSAANITVGPDGRLTAAANGPGGSGGASGPGGVLTDLRFWFKADTANVSNSRRMPYLLNSAPNMLGFNAFAAGKGATGTSTTLNSKPVLALGGSQDTAVYGLGAGGNVANINQSLLDLGVAATIFFVGSASSHTATNGIVGGVSNNLELSISTTGALILVNGSVAVLATSSATVAINTFFQANVTYDGATGNIAFKISRTAAGTASGATHPLTAGSNVVFAETYAGAGAFSGSVAELIIFDRVLTSTEITAVETYLNSQWAV